MIDFGAMPKLRTRSLTAQPVDTWPKMTARWLSCTDSMEAPFQNCSGWNWSRR